MFTILVGGLSWAAVAQNVALKTNLLYWSTVTPNLGLEASIARKHTVQLFYGLNPGSLPEEKFEALGGSARIPLLVLRGFQRVVSRCASDGRRV